MSCAPPYGGHNSAAAVVLSQNEVTLPKELNLRFYLLLVNLSLNNHMCLMAAILVQAYLREHFTEAPNSASGHGRIHLRHEVVAAYLEWGSHGVNNNA